LATEYTYLKLKHPSELIAVHHATVRGDDELKTLQSFLGALIRNVVAAFVKE
jgi:hypothetical protein